MTLLAEFGVLFGVMLVTMALGLPIFLALGLSAGAYVVAFWPKVPLMVIAQGFVQGLDSYGIVAIPFFFLAGEVMNAGGINERLMRFALACLGHIRGGLSHVNVMANMVFAGVSGSAVADASAVGSVMIPAMKKAGYPADYAAAVTAAAATIGPMIPPSIPMVMFGMFAMTSVAKLFIAGVVPGLLMGLFLLAASYWISRRRNYPATAWVGWSGLAQAFLQSFFALLLPLIVIVGIIGGIATVTEVGAIAAIYAAVASAIYGEFRPRRIWRAVMKAGIDSCRVLIILSIAGLFVWIIGNMGVAKLLAAAILSVTHEPALVMAIVCIFLVLGSTLVESVILLVVFVPMLIPTARELGIDLVHFGVVTVFATLIGLIVPPAGILIYVGAAQAEASAHKVVRELVPFVFVLCALLGFLIFFPELSLWLPRALKI